MSAGSLETVKSYVDCGVQAGSPSPLPNTPRLEARKLTSPFSDITSTSLNKSNQVSPSSESSTRVSSAYNQSLALSSPVSIVGSTQRVLKPPRLPRQIPSRSHSEVGRLFSLPESTPVVSAKTELNVAQRIVSMPEQRSSGSFVLDYSLSSDSINASLYSGSSFQSDNDTDSVLIIENNGELSEAFLRNECIGEVDIPSDSEKEQEQSNEEGWITWAKSPPRPIPALHGPLSLPYARCPSGAEGTIIEERDHLPRMIWGLEAEDPSTNPASSDSQAVIVGEQPPTTPHAAPQLAQSPAIVLPIQDVGHPPLSNEHSVVSMSRSLTAARPRDQPWFPKAKPAPPPVDTLGIGYAHNDPIDLERLPVHGDNNRRRYQESGSVSNDYLARALDDILHLQDADTDLVGQRHLNHFQGSSGYVGRPTSRVNNGNNNNNVLRSSQVPGFSKPAPAMRVSSRPAVGSALPQIFLEPRSPENPRAPPHRPSAMEIAQQYQQQQLQRQANNFLPTPPNSSSPLWSSEFSPYEESVLSPSTSYIPPYATPLHDRGRSSSDASSQLRRLVHERINDMGLSFEMSPSLAPAAQINSSFRSQSHLNFTGSAVSSSQALMNFLARRDLHPVSHLNEEYSSLPALRSSQAANIQASQSYQQTRYAPAHSHIPPSPTSPEVHQRINNYQQPRSIPLARLIQRRLSAVPEEDTNSTVRGPSPSPPPMHSRAYVVPQQQPQHMYATAPHYLHSRLATQSRAFEQAVGEVYGAQQREQVKVRLPLSPVMTRGDEGLQGRSQVVGYPRTEGAGMGQQEEGDRGRGEGVARKKTRGRPRKIFTN